MGSETGQTLHQHVPWCPLEWRTDALPFIDIPFQLLVVFSFISLSLFCPRLETRAYKYSALGSSKEERCGPGCSYGVPFPPFFYPCFVSCNVLHERAGHMGHFLFFFPRHCHHPLPSCSPPHSFSSWAWIFVSMLGNLPPSNSVKPELASCFHSLQLPTSSTRSHAHLVGRLCVNV